LISIKKIEGGCLWHSLHAVVLFFADPSAEAGERGKKEGKKDLER